MSTNDDQADIVRLEGVGVCFGDLVVFDGLDLSVRQGEILTLVGQSGCGKSVLLKLIIGLVQFHQGHIWVDGMDLTGRSELDLLPIRRNVGMVFQGGALFDSLNVFDNIAYPLRERGMTDRKMLDERVAEVLEMVGLPGTEAKLPAHLSGGMRKRVALARAVAEEPKVLLYDEPTTGLDPVNVRRISELIINLRARLNVTSIVVTHDLASAFMVSDRLAMIADRKVVAIDDAARFKSHTDPHVRAFLQAMPFAPEPPP